VPLVLSVGAAQDNVTLSLDPVPPPDELELLDELPVEELLEVTPPDEPLEELLEELLEVAPPDELLEELLEGTPLGEPPEELLDVTSLDELTDGLSLEELLPPQPESTAAIKDAATIFCSNPLSTKFPISVHLAIAFRSFPKSIR
jgi:hypothetical protein